MKKILLSCLLGVASLAYGSEPKSTPSAEIVSPKIISSQNYFITKSYDETVVPTELKKWTSWVNKDNYTKDCIEDFCVFISKLTLQKSQGYNFMFEGSSLTNATYITLPYSDSAWPLSVTVNGRKAIMVNHQSRPLVQVNKGDFKIEVAYNNTIFNKNSSFSLPFNVVSFDNTTSQNISLKDNTLNLNDINQTDEQSAFTEIKVFRKFVDNIPYQLQTNIEINYSGKIKELNLGKVLPENFNLSKINSDLKIIYKNNHYYATLVSGTHFVNFTSFAPKETSSFSIKDLVLDVDSEIWSVEKNNNIRNIDIASANSVDPKQVSVPEQWNTLPAYMVIDKFDIVSNQQGLSLNTDLKVNAIRKSIFGFNDTVYNFDTFTLTNQNSKQLNFYPGVNISSVTMSQPKMLLQEKDYSYVLLNSQDKTGTVQFDTNKNNSISSQLSNNYFLDEWTVYFTPRTDLIWASHATITSPDFWFNSWNLYSLFSLSVLIIALYKLMGVETAIFALFSLFSFYYNNSIFWIFWILLVISYAFNKHLSEKYTNFKRNTNQISLLGTFLVVIFTIEFVVNEIFSIMHPNVSHKLYFSPGSSLLLMIVLLFIYKIFNKIYSQKNTIHKRKFGWLAWCVLGLLCLSLPYIFSTSNSTMLGSSSHYQQDNALPTSEKISINSENITAVRRNSENPEYSRTDATGIIADTDSTLNEIAAVAQNNIVAKTKSSIVRDITQEKVQVGHEVLPVNRLHSYTVEPKNKDSVKFYVASKWLVNLYGVFQCVFLILFTYVLIVYYLLVFKKQALFNKLPLFLSRNILVEKIKSKIIEA